MTSPLANPNPKATAYRVFILVVSLVSLLVVAALLLVPLDAETARLLILIDFIACGVFFCDFLYSLATAQDRWRYLRTWGWVDLLASVPAVDALRFARGFRVLRIIRLLRVIRSVRELVYIFKHYRRRSAVAALGLALFLSVTLGSILVLHFEHAAEGSNITTGNEALWWAWVTMTTVGYGDRTPITAGGRMVAVVMMTVGIGCFSTLSGLVASWLLGGDRGETASDQSQSESSPVDNTPA